MKPIAIALACALTLAAATSAEAHSSLVRIGVGGHFAKVAARAAANFQALLNDLRAHGYPIKFIGGWRAHGSCRGCDMHPRGLAIDVNQTGRDSVIVPLSRSLASRLAHAHGLISGGDWCDGDLGHFELASASRADHVCRGHHTAIMSARARRARHERRTLAVDVAAQPAYPFR